MCKRRGLHRASESAEQVGSPSPLDKVQTVNTLHRAGRLREAQALYSQILLDHPDNFDAAHLLAIAASKIGEGELAAQTMRHALSLRPSHSVAWFNFAAICHSCGRYSEAEHALRKVIEIDPNADNAHNELGVLLCSQGRIAEGASSFETGIKLNPSNAELLNNLANARKEQGDLDAAEALYRAALDLRPAFSEASNNLGLLLQRQGDYEAAQALYRRAIAANPGFGDAHSNLAGILRNEGKLAESEAAYGAALAANPSLPEAHSGLGNLLQVLGDLDGAEAHCRKALEVNPGYADAINNLAKIYARRGDTAMAETWCQKALIADPLHLGAMNNLGLIANQKNDHSSAEREFRRALGINPQHSVSRYNLSISMLMQGHYAEGFLLYESRFDAFKEKQASAAVARLGLAQRARWNGESLKGRRLLIWTEQGLGDSVMMMRYLPMLRTKGAGSVVIYCPPELERSIRTMDGVDYVVADARETVHLEFDIHCPIMSLPLAFGTTVHSIPQSVPYISVPEEMKQAWRARLQKNKKPLVGVAWSGSKTLQDDARRSIPFETLHSILALENVDWISLQKGEPAGAWNEAGLSGGQHIDRCSDLLETAALIERLDLVISVDTVVAHLAGALARPVWLLNRHGSEWRWGLKGDASPWYPTMKVVRQSADETWLEVLDRVKHLLS